MCLIEVVRKKPGKGKKCKPSKGALVGRVRSEGHQKKQRKCDYIMIHILCTFWHKFIDFIYAILKKFPVPISNPFPGNFQST
jgi:hypothetical protein